MQEGSRRHTADVSRALSLNKLQSRRDYGVQKKFPTTEKL